MNLYWRTTVETHSRLSAAGIPYCIVKCYGGDLNYNDGNVDLVVLGSLWKVFRGIFTEDYTISLRDLVKHLFYERNKLMLTPVHSSSTRLHLHSSVGWSDIPYISSEHILNNAVIRSVAGYDISILRRDEDARVLILHVIFEQFKNNRWDKQFLRESDYVSFGNEFHIRRDDLKQIAGSEGIIPLRCLSRIWSRCWKRMIPGVRVTMWNRFLHYSLLIVQLSRYRVRKHLNRSI